MPLQNRVHPGGELHAVPERGTMLGNRGGKFHREDKTLGKRRWASTHWIACELHYKNMHHEPMGQGYTSLFFLDEVTALAAGHRPCFFCRRAEAKRFVELSGMVTKELDIVLHAERTRTVLKSVTPAKAGVQLSPPEPIVLKRGPGLRRGDGLFFDYLPDGTFVQIDSQPFAIRGDHLLRWSFAGYIDVIPRKASMRANLLTPPTIVGILEKGYQPRWHPSALTWGTS
jgi:hypothetical protein